MSVHIFQLWGYAPAGTQTVGYSELLCGTVAGLTYKLAEAMELAGGADYIQSGELLEQLVSLALSHAADERGNQLGTIDFLLSYSAQLCQNAVFGMLANRTGIENYDVRLIGGIGKLETLADKLIGYKLTIELIHLAAKGSYMDS